MTDQVQIVLISTLGSMFTAVIPTVLLIVFHKTNKKRIEASEKKLDKLTEEGTETLAKANGTITALNMENGRLQNLVDRLNAVVDAASRFSIRRTDPATKRNATTDEPF